MKLYLLALCQFYDFQNSSPIAYGAMLSFTDIFFFTYFLFVILYIASINVSTEFTKKRNCQRKQIHNRKRI